MAHEVLMPKLSSTMTEGTITVWLKNEGDTVEIGEAIFEVMTDKIAIEVEAYEEGTLLKRYVEAEESAPVNSVVAYIGAVGEAVPNEKPLFAEEKATNESVEKPKVPLTDGHLSTNTTEKIRATPAARKLAREMGIDLSSITGSGPKGRVQRQDVKRLGQTSETADQKVATQSPLIPWSGIRKSIADKMQHSMSTIPHVTMNAEINMTEIIKLREQLLPMIETETKERMSYLEIFMKATTIALKAYPVFNSHALPEGILPFEEVNIGVAVAISEGLVVPVVKNANHMGLIDLTKAIKQLTTRAREGKLLPTEMSGGTFTISSLGKTRVKEFTPIINAPEVAILGIGGLYDQFSTNFYNGLETVETVPTLTVCLSFDHRVVDGAPAAAFLSMIVELLENPMKLLL